MILQLDYQINHVFNNYRDEDGMCHYDYVESEIMTWSLDICKLLKEKMDIDITPKVIFKTSRTVADKAWKILDKLSLHGIYGDKFLNKW